MTALIVNDNHLFSICKLTEWVLQSCASCVSWRKKTRNWRIDDLIVDYGKNIVVLVDDIYTLDVTEVQYVFKLVKLFSDFPRTSYVLSFDEVVAVALAPKYGGERKIAGYDSLKKSYKCPWKIKKRKKRTVQVYTGPGK